MKKNVNKVVVLSYYITPRGYSYDTPWRKVCVDAFFGALDQTKLKVEDIQCGSVAYNERGISEAAIGTQVSDALGLNPGCSLTPVSHACAGGGMALYNTWNYISSGQYDVGLVLSFQVGDSFDNMEAMNPIGNHSDYDYALGFTHVEYSFLRDCAYKNKYANGSVIPSAKWTWQMHEYARMTPGSCEYGKDMPLWEDVSAETDAGERIRNAAARGATATATILISEEKAKKLKLIDPITCYVSYAFRPPYIGNHINFAGDPNYEPYGLAEQPGIMQAAKDCYKMANITTDDINVAAVHDLSGFEGVYSIEALGICPIGKGGEFIEKGGISLTGKCPTNTHGGGIAYGHTSVGSDFQINMFEVCNQLHGICGERQIKDPKIGVAQAYGTHHSYDVVAVMKKGEIK